ncbi:uncharacterized protein lrrfip1a isoform X2 [Halichoeres trimaculatus]|uniref:uncharacterized protein lrrfip1a isoform X2 n=1 Tax=Halichoeres trimaculatus TaxID=147232 RepID=UPI003D9FA8FB
MGTQGTGRKRSTKKERSTAEDDALNLIAREAEARLAAKRAARAEAREIRMKELERQQKELSDEDERMSVGSRGSVRGEDRDYQEKGSRAASALTAGTLTSLGGSSSRRGSGETAITVDAETSLREIKDTLAEVEEKYRKAMVSNAQLDNEKNNLMYQVDTLKDSLMELEELLSESRREFEEKVKEYEREKHAHSVLQFQFNEMKETLKQSEELLNEIRQLRLKQEGFVREISDLQETVEWKDKKIGALERQKEYTDAIRIERDELREEVVKLKDILKKHGIVLGPDLNINGDSIEAQEGGSPSEDPSSPLTQDSKTSPTEGNSMLGITKDTQLRSGREERMDREQHQEVSGEIKVKPSGSETVCSVAEEQKTQFAAKEDSDPSQKQNTDLTDVSVTKVKDTIDNSSSLEKNVEEMEEGGRLGETAKQDLVDGEKTVEGSNSSKRDSSPQQEVAQDVLKETLPNQECDNTKKVETEKEEESKPQGATNSGKKKKKKKKGKKKSGKNEDDCQQKDETPKEKSKADKGLQSAALDGTINARFCCWPVTETLKELKGNQVKNKEDKQKSKEASGVEVVKATKSVNFSENVTEIQVDDVADENGEEQTLKTENLGEEEEAFAPVGTTEAPHDLTNDRSTEQKIEQQSLETETAKVEEATATTDTLPKEFKPDPKKDQQDKEQRLEKTEDVGSSSIPAQESNLSPPDSTGNSSDAEIFEDVAKVCTSSEENGEMDVTEEHGKEQAMKKENGEEVATCAITEASSECRANHVTEINKEEQSLNTGTEKAVKVMASSETLTCADTLKVSKTHSAKDEQERNQSQETSEVEEESTTNAGSEINFGASDFEDSLDAGSTSCSAHRCTSSEENSDIDNSTNSSVIQSELMDSTESEAGSVDDLKSECTANSSQCAFETIYEENTEADLYVPGHGGVLEESQSTNSLESSLVYSTSTDGLSDCQQSLSGSEQPSELMSEHLEMESGSDNTPLELSERGSEEETETVIDLAESRTELISEPGNLDSRSVNTPVEISEDETEKDDCYVEPSAELLSETVDGGSGSDHTAIKVCEKGSEEGTKKDKDQVELRAELQSEPANVDLGDDNTPIETSVRDVEEKSENSIESVEARAERLTEPADADLSSDKTPNKVSEKGSEEETLTVRDNEDPEAETEQESSSPSLDTDHSALTPDKADNKGLNEDLRDPEGLDKPESSSLDKITDASEIEKGPLEAVVQSHDEEQIQTLESEDETDVSHAGPSQETEKINMVDVLDTPESPKDGAEISSSPTQDQSTQESVTEEEPEKTKSQTDEQSGTHVFPLIELRHELLKDKSDDCQRSEGSSQPTLLDSEEENSVDEEGQSFDFDDLDLDDAIAMSLSEDPKQISIVEGIEIVSKDSSRGSIEFTQSNDESIEDKLLESNDKCTTDGSPQVDTLHPDPDAVSQDTLNSWAQGDISSENVVEDQAKILEEVGVTEELRDISEEGNALKVRELRIGSQKTKQATSLPLEEGLDALNDEDSASLKSWDVVSSNLETPQTGKSSRKSSKKSKNKGKEDCKMS